MSLTQLATTQSEDYWRDRAKKLLTTFDTPQADGPVVYGCGREPDRLQLEAVTKLLKQVDNLKAVCLKVCITADSYKEFCGEPESQQAIRNTRFANLAVIAAKGLYENDN